MEIPRVDMYVNQSAIICDKNELLSFADLSKPHQDDTRGLDTNTEFNLAPSISQSWRDDTRKTLDCPDTSPSMSGSPQEQDKVELGLLEKIFSNIEDKPTMIPSSKEAAVKQKPKLKSKDDTVMKRPTRTLVYPPCCVCGSKASGDHYGVNSCEACKGFFRRYLLRKKGAYECKNGGHCEVVYTRKGMCPGCRLRKCLELGMSKDRCKLGRYSAEKRTEKIRTVKEINEGITFYDTDLSMLNSSVEDENIETDMISKTLAGLKINEDMEVTFSEDLIRVLIRAKDEMWPFGKKVVNTHEGVREAIRNYHEEFELKVKLYGNMKAVSKEEFLQLYQTYGIDVDNRLADIKQTTADIDDEVFEMCNFAKHIPFFSKLSIKDQSNLLKVGILDMYTTLACHGYDPELQICLDRNKAFHISEMNKFFSQAFVSESLKCMLHCQQLQLSEEEQVLVMAISLFFTDRCSLENPHLVEKIQLSLTHLLKRYLDRICSGSSRKRFTDIIDYLTSLRKAAGMFVQELEEICTDEVYCSEFPFILAYLPKE